MILRQPEELTTKTRQDGFVMTEFFGPAIPGGSRVSMGYSVMPPGTVVPPNAHEEDEYAYFLSGSAKCRINGQVYTATQGCASFIPAGEVHSSFNDSEEPATLIWVMVGK